MSDLENLRETLPSYLVHCCENHADVFIVAHEGVEKTVAEWCIHFGGTPESTTNYIFLNEKLQGKLDPFHE